VKRPDLHAAGIAAVMLVVLALLVALILTTGTRGGA